MVCAKNLIFGLSAKKKLTEDIFQLSDNILSCFGKKFENGFGSNSYNSFSDFSRLKNSGYFFYEKIINEMTKSYGSGIPTSLLILNKILKESVMFLSKSHNSRMLQKGIKEGAKQISSLLQKSSRTVENIDTLKSVAQTASLQDPEITELVCNTLGQLGNSDLIFIEKSNEINSFIEVNKGIRLNQGYAHPLFISDPVKQRTFIENSHILISNIKITSIQTVLNLLKRLPEKKLLIICENISPQILSMLLANRIKGLLDIVITKTLKNPCINEETLKNIALLTGGRVFLKQHNDSLENCSLQDLGFCSRIEITSSTTIIINNKSLKSGINVPEYPESKPSSHKIFNLIGTIFVGAATEQELFHKQNRILSAVKSTKASLNQGVILGGGLSLFHASQEVLRNYKINDISENIGLYVICNACLTPLKTLIKNNTKTGDYEKFLQKISCCKDKKIGFNINSLSLDDFLSAGIFDSTQIINHSILKASEIACDILSCETLIEEHKIYE